MGHTSRHFLNTQPTRDVLRRDRGNNWNCTPVNIRLRERPCYQLPSGKFPDSLSLSLSFSLSFRLSPLRLSSWPLRFFLRFQFACASRNGSSTISSSLTVVFCSRWNSLFAIAEENNEIINNAHAHDIKTTVNTTNLQFLLEIL